MVARHLPSPRPFWGSPFLRLALLAMSIFGVASADEWRLPETRTYVAVNGRWRFTVKPRPVASQLSYFQDKAAGKANAGAMPEVTPSHAEGLLEHLEHGQWVSIWKESLLNEISPVDAAVSSSGQTATFDNWHSMGYGSDVVVLYDAHGKPVRSMSLQDFLPAEYIRALPRSVSSIWWGDRHHFSVDGGWLVLRVVVPSMSQRPGVQQRHVELRFNSGTGEAAASSGKAWADALKQAHQVDAGNRVAEARSQARFIAPLLAPHTDSERDWHLYLVEAFFRIDPTWRRGYPATQVLRLPHQRDYQASVGFLKASLQDHLNRDGVIMVASPSQDNLVKVLSELAATVPSGWLSRARIYVAVDEAHSLAVARALTPTGAEYLQLDPTKPIAQRQERLDDLQSGSRAIE